MLQLLNFAQTYTYQTSSGDQSSGAHLAFGIAIGLVAILTLIGVWKTFQKAGQHGWAAIIPIYNQYVMTQVAGRPGWWTILFFIPIVNIAVGLIIALDIAKRFSKDPLFGVILLWLLSPIGYIMLGFGQATYQQASSDGSTTAEPPYPQNTSSTPQ